MDSQSHRRSLLWTLEQAIVSWSGTLILRALLALARTIFGRGSQDFSTASSPCETSPSPACSSSPEVHHEVKLVDYGETGPDGTHRWYFLHEERFHEALRAARDGELPWEIMLNYWTNGENLASDSPYQQSMATLSGVGVLTSGPDDEDDDDE